MTDARLAIVAPLKEWGGLERKFSILCEEFLRRGVVPELVRVRGGLVPDSRGWPKGARSVDLGTRSKIDGIGRLARYLRRAAPDAVLTARDHSAQATLLARMLVGRPIPVFVKVTNMPSVVIRRPIQRLMARRLYPRADAVIAISQGVADDVVDYLGVPRERIKVIYNPMVTSDFPSRMAREVASPWLDRGAECPVIVAAGRLTPQKDFHTLLEAFARLRRERPVRLIILGEGPERASLEGEVARLGLEDHVALPGRVEDPVPYMARSALFAFSSRYEGLGNVLIEALAAGCRVVATDCPSGPREILDDGRYGFLVAPGDAQALAGAMASALDQPAPDSAEIARFGRRFQAESVADQYLRLMELGNDR